MELREISLAAFCLLTAWIRYVAILRTRTQHFSQTAARAIPLNIAIVLVLAGGTFSAVRLWNPRQITVVDDVQSLDLIRLQQELSGPKKYKPTRIVVHARDSEETDNPMRKPSSGLVLAPKCSCSALTENTGRTGSSRSHRVRPALWPAPSTPART